MNRFPHIAVFFAAVLLVAADKKPEKAKESAPSAPAGAAEFQGNRYMLYSQRMTWKTADQKCRSLGGQLVCIETAAEAQFVTQLAKGKRVWLGASRNAGGQWTWVNGKPMTFKKWSPGEPNNYRGTEDCLQLGSGGTWNDSMSNPQSQWAASGYICEWEKVKPLAGVSSRPSSEERNYSAVFPGKPKETTQTISTDLGDIKVFMLIYEAPDGASAFVVAYSDYPKELVAKSTAEAMLNVARDGAAKKIGGKVVSETKTSIDNHPGRIIKIEVAEPELEVQAKMFLVGTRLYQVLTVSKKDQNNTETVKKFLNSFKLTQSKVQPKTPERPAGAAQFQGHWYKLYQGEMHWNTAAERCRRLGGRLVSIETEKEAKFIVQLSGNQRVWLGGFKKPDGSWHWVNGKPLTFTSWDVAEPNNSEGREDRMYLFTNGRWHDINGAVTLNTGFICEWDD